MTNLDYTKVEQLVPATLRGFRSWSLAPDLTTGQLSALHHYYGWPAGVAQAQCMALAYPLGHVSPVFECTCGFYATYRPSTAPHGLVSGVIKASGRVVMGQKGFRAEKAEIEALCLNRPGNIPYKARPVAEILTAFYDVPVLGWQELVEAYPMADVTELVGHVPTVREGWLASCTNPDGAWRLSQLDAEILWDWAGCTEHDHQIAFDSVIADFRDDRFDHVGTPDHRAIMSSKKHPYVKAHLRTGQPVRYNEVKRRSA